MKSFATIIIIVLFGASILFAATPKPGLLTIEFGCQSVNLHWGAADSAEYHPDGYVVYRAAETRYDWTQITPHLITDTSYTDYDLVIGDQFNYAVVAHYPEGNSLMSIGTPKSIYNPADYDVFIVGNEESGDINWWYYNIFSSLGLRVIIIEDILPYCGDMLADFPLLAIVKMGNTWNPIQSNPERETAIADYLDNDGRLYVHDPYQTYSARISSQYLGYDFTTCIPYPFYSIHGINGTFSESLRYSFTDSLLSSGLGPVYFEPSESYSVMDDDVRCGCVDLAVNREGYKAVVNSQPLNLSTGHDTTGTMLTYFERMMEFFDILSSVDRDGTGQLPDKMSLFAYPNPFNSSVKIRLLNADLQADQKVAIYDVTGRQVRNITMPERAGEVVWDGKDDSGQGVSSGVYFAMLTDGNSSRQVSAKVTLLK